MATDIKSLKSRIKSVNSTYQLTKAMELVASAKIRGATETMNKAGEYLKAALGIVREISKETEARKSVYMKVTESGKTAIIVIAGDRGLAGGYNSNIFKLLGEYKNSEVIPIGKIACEKYQREILKVEKFNFADAKKISKKLCKGFKQGEYTGVSIVYTKFISMLTRLPEYEVVLPLKMTKDISKSDIIYEPDASFVLDRVVEEYIAAKIFGAVREGFVSELASRRLAMESAGKNASEMLDKLKLQYNRARQGTITQEITEIVAGSES